MRHKQQNLDRRFDKTQLHEKQHGQLVHRDYAAHFFRWGFAANFIGPGAHVLDVGCGQDLNLVRVVNAKLATLPELYVGVDLNKIKECNISWVRLFPEFSFVDHWKRIVKAHGQFDVVTCFEVIEHMHKPDGLKLLKGVRECMTKNAVFLLSTPVYDGRRMAANHIHEYQTSELADLVQRAGLKVEKRFGTYARAPQIKKAMTKAERELVEELHEYYSWEVLNCFLAPKYPDACANNIWMLRRG